MKHNQLVTILVCLLVIIPVSYYSYRCKQERASNRQQLERLHTGNEFLFEMQMKGFIEDGRSLNNVSLFDREGLQLSLKDVVQNKDQLIIYVPNISCSSCVDAELICFLNEQKNNESQRSVIFISEFRDQRDIGSFMNAYKFEQVLSLSKGSDLGIMETEIMNKSVKPALFILSKDLSMSCFFFSDRSFPLRTQKYLEIVSKRLSIEDTSH